LDAADAGVGAIGVDESGDEKAVRSGRERLTQTLPNTTIPIPTVF
jgi:hypothetical protein